MTTVNTGESARPYSDFIADKTRSMASSGFDPETLSEHLFPFQRDIVARRSRHVVGYEVRDQGVRAVSPGFYIVLNGKIQPRLLASGHTKKLLREAEHMARLLIYGGEKDVAVLWVPS